VRERQHYNATLGMLAIACWSYALLQTAMAPALGTLQRDLHTTPTWSTWIMTSFLLSAAITTPIIGKLGDQYGKKRLMLISLTIFLVGCIGAAVSWNIWSLIGFRALQGSAGALFALSFAIVRDEFPSGKAGGGIAFLSSLFGVGAGLGIVISGLIVDNFSWRWLFISPAIAIVISLALIARFVPESPVKAPNRVDLPGALLFGSGLGALLLGLTEAENWGWGSAAVLGLFALSVVLLTVWLYVERRVPQPLIDLDVFSQRPVLLANATSLMLGVAMFASFITYPLFVETPRGMDATTQRLADYGLGLTATQTGLTMLPSSILMLGVGLMVGRIGARFGMKWPLAVGSLVLAGATFALAIWHDYVWQLVLEQALFGTGIALTMGSLPALVTESVRQTETGVANGMNVVIRQVGMVIGTQIGAVFLAAYTIGSSSVPSETGFTATFILGGVCAVVAAFFAVLVTPSRRGRRQELALAGAGAGQR
jgi:MFS family permease